ncbi:MAG: helix-turn-helix transcriptional regulator [Pseudomonadota bacterium]
MGKVDYATLSRQGKFDNVSAAIRLKAAREFAQLSQKELGDATGRTVSNISNMENARSFPALEVMMYLWNSHRVDVNFMVGGAYSQLPSDVLVGLMDALASVTETTDLLSGSEKPPKNSLKQLP